jgi:AAA domain-containing protein
MVTARFQDEGGVVADGTYYVEREADGTLFERLREGRLCVVLAPRQIGKSSLRDRTQRRLAEAGITAVHVDVSIYTSSDAKVTEHWFYGGVIREIVRTLGWDESRVLADRSDRPPAGWWNEFVAHELPERAGKPTVIFLDEIDSVRRLAFEPDAFFTSIRLAMNQAPVTFCLLGTMTPWEILRNPKAPPFNAGVQVRLEDFTRDEAKALLPGLAPLGDAEAILDEVLAWTAGHPYLTQRVCAALVADGSTSVAAIVDQAILQQHGDPLFAYTETAFDLYAGGPAGVQLVELYGQLLRDERITPDASSREQLELRVTGMAAEREHGGTRTLAVRNRIYARHFDDAWLKRRRMHRFLAAAVTHWRESKRNRGLLGGGDLDDVIQWATSQASVSGEELAFLVASQEAAQGSRLRHLNLWRGGLVASLLVLLVSVVWLVSIDRHATKQLDSQGETIGSLTQQIDTLKSQQKNEVDTLKQQLGFAQQLAESRKQTNEALQANLDKFNTALVELEQTKVKLQAKSQRNLDELRQQLEAAQSTAQRARSDADLLQRQASLSAEDAARAKFAADAATRQAIAAADLAKRKEDDRLSLEQQLQQTKAALEAAENRAKVAESSRVSTEGALTAAQKQLTNQGQLASQLTDLQKQLTDAQADLKAVCQKLPVPPKPPC